MKTSVENALINWLSKLDSLVGDTQAEIEKRRADNVRAVQMREDLKSLIEYMEKNDLPEPVWRALWYSLSWNPHAKANDD